MTRPRATLRDQILREALTLIDTEGPAALTVRAVAARSDCSTIGVYTHFGGKEGLLEAILVEAYADFAATLAAADAPQDHAPGSGLERLVRAAHRYRDWALANRPRYVLMFAPDPSAPALPDDVYAGGRRSRAEHEARVRHAMAIGDLRRDDVVSLAGSIWAHGHGWVMLELTGLLYPPEVEAPDPGAVRELFDRYTRSYLEALAPR